MSRSGNDARHGRQGGRITDYAKPADPLKNAKRCTVCRGIISYPTDRTMHYICDPETSTGKICTCPSGCVGGGGTVRCAPHCKVPKCKALP